MTTNATVDSTRPIVHADLGDAWLRGQMARLHQAHLQFGRRWRLDVDALVARAAGMARAAQPA